MIFISNFDSKSFKAEQFHRELSKKASKGEIKNSIEYIGKNINFLSSTDFEALYKLKQKASKAKKDQILISKIEEYKSSIKDPISILVNEIFERIVIQLPKKAFQNLFLTSTALYRRASDPAFVNFYQKVHKHELLAKEMLILAFRAGDHLEEMNLSKARKLSQITDQDIKDLSAVCPNLKSINVGRYKIDQKTVRKLLKKLKALDSIYIENMTLTDTKRFKKKLGLQHLRLQCSTHDRSLVTFLSAFTALKSLNLEGCSGNEQNNEHIISILPQNIQALRLNSSVSDRNVQSIVKRFPNISELGIDGLQVTNVSLGLLSALTNLRVLNIQGSRTDDDGVALLANHIFLETLFLGNVSDKGLKALTSLKNLKVFSQCNCHFNRISDEGLLPLTKNLTNLESLNLSYTNAKREGFTSISRLTNLKNLNLHMTSITNKDLETILPSLSNLEFLDLSYCSLNDEGSKIIPANLSKLKHLELAGSDVSDQTVELIASYLPDLEYLTLSGAGITDNGIIAIANRCSNLQILRLIDCSITTKGIKAIGENLKCLLNINIKYNIGAWENNMDEALIFLSYFNSVNESTIWGLKLIPSDLAIIQSKYPEVSIYKDDIHKGISLTRSDRK